MKIRDFENKKKGLEGLFKGIEIKPFTEEEIERKKQKVIEYRRSRGETDGLLH